MSTDPVIAYYAESVVRQLLSRGMLFVQGTANLDSESAPLLAAVVAHLESSTKLSVVILKAGEEPPSRIATDTAAAIVIIDLEEIADTAGTSWLATTRPILVNAVELGSRVLIYSTVPRLRLRSTAGSLVSMDCAYYRFEEVKPDLATSAWAGLPETVQQNIAEWSQMQPSLLRRFIEIARLDVSNRVRRRLSDEALRGTAGLCFTQLGPDIVSWLEHWVAEFGLEQTSEIDVPSDVLEALRSAGLVRQERRDDSFEVFPGPGKALAEKALRDHIDKITRPPIRWADVAAELFTLERMLRIAAKEYAVSVRANSWTDLLPAGPLAKAIGRAESEIPNFRKRAAFGNPLEWMTLTEIDEVLAVLCEEKGVLHGVPSRVWRSLFDEVGPIRNRVAHMRLTRFGDLDVVRRWQRVLRMYMPDFFPRL